ncbi:hypothetical protein PhiCh1p66 [Natrialba phage PhiCh1]|uniref:Virus protein phiCh1-VP65 n=2 Tax=root TaxID=1 RepID=D3T2B6_NATMM|nr:hypothetical protein [Natrialba magadii]NP_665983.1 hypothetical protein PhiCh1p66 [Natrialba phage PhiCh1]YP_010078091.1 uncharacterized protein KMC42_gp61 [Natrialba phage PhiCh1]AAM88739.1 unknown [Natrialba phage PhiCh1]ADD07725.1 virus protein phiCh1-VP65 [Natrialba magadii ATCC 43099]ELY22972.1 hypothetical protein C500_20950 [Natrialba magadii ATCC 43099]QBJ01242.1 uncharacterized protein PhiCh1_300 [Natrialba phage PhiCh1]
MSSEDSTELHHAKQLVAVADVNDQNPFDVLVEAMHEHRGNYSDVHEAMEETYDSVDELAFNESKRLTADGTVVVE